MSGGGGPLLSVCMVTDPPNFESRLWADSNRERREGKWSMRNGEMVSSKRIVRWPSKNPIYAHKPALVTSRSFPFRQREKERVSLRFDFGWNTDNRPTRTRTMSPFEAGGNEKSVTGDYTESLTVPRRSCYALVLKCRVTVYEGERRCRFSLDDIHQLHNPRPADMFSVWWVYSVP